jgi:uroporphyrinogen-III synthase
VADPTPSSLKGKRVIVTRAIEQTSDLLARLTERGAIPVSLPLVSFAPPEDYTALDAALNQLQSFDWIIFTSANAVHAITARARSHPPSPLKTLKIAAVGPTTKSEAEQSGLSVTYVAKTHLGIALAEELREHLTGKSVFLPRSDKANPDLPAALRKLGARVTEVTAYRTISPAATDKSGVNAVIKNDAILFFSPSAVHNFADLAGRVRLASLQDKIAIAAVGPVTASALRELGVHRIAIAADTTAAAVVDALEAHFAASAATSQKKASSTSATGATKK